MAARPWVTPDDVRNYTERESVANRTDERLEVDIARAEQYVISYTNNLFECVDEVPGAVKTAVILLAEAYAWNTYLSTRELQSETYDEYSYTAGGESIDTGDLDLGSLLDPFIIEKPSGNVIVRLRRL